jgi:hypothetical protein
MIWLWMVGCVSEPVVTPPSYPATANVETYTQMKADLAAVRHVSDGGGRVWLERGTTVVAGETGTWTLGFEVGPDGIADGGVLFFVAPPFWGWSTPQVEHPGAPGFTEVRSDADARLSPTTADQQLLAIEVGGGLSAGDQVFVTYTGRADRFAERQESFWFAVDGDGDGIRKNTDPIHIDVLPGPARRLMVTLPSAAEPGHEIRLVIAAMDARGNAHPEFAGTLEVTGPASLGLPKKIEMKPEDRGCVSVTLIPKEAGVLAVEVVGPDGLGGHSNPMVVRIGAAPILWGDLQIHTGLSDGTGTPEDAYIYARDVAALDVAVVTDHDHWGMRFLDADPVQWERIKSAAEAAYVPGEFVTAVGYEWTNWIHGHRHVVFFGDGAALYSALDDRYDTPDELWAALEGRDAITIAHHSAGGPVAVNWAYPPDPILEPITEIASVHGQSEAPSTPGVIYDSVPGNFIIDQLDKGYRLGFIGSTDGHDGHPGLAHLAARTGGLAAILAEDHTRASVLKAIRSRRVYATNGVRIILRFELGDHAMGAVIAPPRSPLIAKVRAVGTAPIERIELVRSGETVDSAIYADTVAYKEWTLADLVAGEFVYVRVLQSDGGIAWSSPIFVE